MPNMLPFRRSRNGFRVRAGRFGLVLVLAVLALAGAPASAEDVPPLPAEFLPADDPAWRDLEDLWNLGGLTDLPLFTRPLPRVDVAAALERTLQAQPELAARPSAIRLRRELTFERAALGEAATEATSPLIELREEDALV
ncbi:MAG: hypothetical protein KC591_18195, partial [Gemmatimonadetes bacterium]|nr:hypothetical protein [Gemmatimonadota bacterium]